MASDLLKTSSGLQGPDNGPWCLPSKPGQACKVLTQVLFLSSRPHWPPRSLCHVAPQRLQRGTLDLGDWLRLQPGTVRQRRCPAGSRFSAPTFLDQRALHCLHHHAKPEEKDLAEPEEIEETKAACQANHSPDTSRGSGNSSGRRGSLLGVAAAVSGLEAALDAQVGAVAWPQGQDRVQGQGRRLPVRVKKPSYRKLPSKVVAVAHDGRTFAAGLPRLFPRAPPTV